MMLVTILTTPRWGCRLRQHQAWLRYSAHKFAAEETAERFWTEFRTPFLRREIDVLRGA